MPVSVPIRPWPDPVLDTLGHDPRSQYVESFWLPTLGPTAILVMRLLADAFDRAPDGFDLPIAETSRRLGLGERDGSTSPLLRTLRRLETFDVVRVVSPDDDVRHVRRMVPPVQLRHVRRLPPSLQSEHERWVRVELQSSAGDTVRRRARRMAFTLLATGDDPDTAERALGRVGFHPRVADDATRWAYERHRDALAAAGGEDATTAAHAVSQPEAAA